MILTPIRSDPIHLPIQIPIPISIYILTIARSGQLAGYIVPKSVIKWGEPNYRSEPTVTVRCVGLSLLVDSNHLLLKKEKQVFHSVTVRCEWQ